MANRIAGIDKIVVHYRCAYEECDQVVTRTLKPGRYGFSNWEHDTPVGWKCVSIPTPLEYDNPPTQLTYFCGTLHAAQYLGTRMAAAMDRREMERG